MTAAILLSLTLHKESQLSWEKLTFKSFHRKSHTFSQFLWTSSYKQFGNPEILYCNPNRQVINYAAVRLAHGLVLSEISVKVFDQSHYRLKKTLRNFCRIRKQPRHSAQHCPVWQENISEHTTYQRGLKRVRLKEDTATSYKKSDVAGIALDANVPESTYCLVLSDTDILVYNGNPSGSTKTASPLSPALAQPPKDTSLLRETDVLPLAETFLLTKPLPTGVPGPL